MDDVSYADILSHTHWRHRIPLESVRVTPGAFGSKWDPLNLPDDMTGKYMLAIGADEGIHAFEAEVGARTCAGYCHLDCDWLGTEMAG